MTERLEGEHIPTESRALKYLWRFACIMAQRSPPDTVAVLSSRQCIVVPLARAMKEKMMPELDDPNWVFAMAFMAYMDPSGEYFAVHTWSIYLDGKQLYECPIFEANIVIAGCCIM